MRIGIREQLAIILLLASLGPLAVMAILTWTNNYNFVVSIKSGGLSLTASLKAAQISADLVLLQSTCQTVITRILFQNTLKEFYRADVLQPFNWTVAYNDLLGGLTSGGFAALLQVTVFSRNHTGDVNGLLNVSAMGPGVALSYTYPNGSHYMLGDAGFGYPPPLYPNLTYTSTSNPDQFDLSVNETMVYAFADFPLNSSSALLLGPLQINNSYALLSLTLPIIDNADANFVLGYMTVVAAATALIDATQSRDGLDETGVILIVGPDRRENLFNYQERPATANYLPPVGDLAEATVKYVFPPLTAPGQENVHEQYTNNLTQYGSSSFAMKRYQAIIDGFGDQNTAINNANSILSTTNEDGAKVSVGFAQPQSELVDWLLIIEESYSEAWAPINRLRNILLACVFGTLGLLLIVTLPLAHFGVRPIRRLQEATKNSVDPPRYLPLTSDMVDDPVDTTGDDEIGAPLQRRKTGFALRLRNLGRRRPSDMTHSRHDDKRRSFKIPAKVQDGKHFIKDELTELTETFNNMSDELMLQYTRLEDKVAERTRELELSKKAAESANESKTLFIANISHELKTPLNGILGMCAVCMSESDLGKIRHSLQIVYKSGDLLLHLLNDLLTFSKNQIGQYLGLEEKEFHLADIKSQIAAIFDKQARDGKVNFSVDFYSHNGTDLANDTSASEALPSPALGPGGIGRLKDMCLWGDQHRILQIIINLVSNSLKFTPENGKVQVRISCLGEDEDMAANNPRNSTGSRQNNETKTNGSNVSQTSRSVSNHTEVTRDTALHINPMNPKANSRVHTREEAPHLLPPNTKMLIFEFQVKDTGPGIPEHLQKKVFEPFVQGDLGLNKKFGGTGLGLSICSQLASLMNGTISLVSAEGVGSTFTIRIPLRFVRERTHSSSTSDIFSSRSESMSSRSDEHATEKQNDAKGGPVMAITGNSLDFQKDAQPRLVGLSQPFFAFNTPLSISKDPNEHVGAVGLGMKGFMDKIRVLVVEDNLVNQEVVLRMLKLEKIYDIVIASDGQEAFDIVKKNMEENKAFNLILMDVQMPNLDGLQSTRLIREMGYSAPIVALTAFAEESNVKECLDSGMDMFLSKPIRRPALKQVLKKFATIPE